MTFIFYGFLALVLIVIVDLPFAKRRQKHTRDLSEAAFKSVYTVLSVPPVLVVTNSYGYPAFTVTFSSKTDMEAAASLNDAFTQSIGGLFKECGPKTRPFSAKLAVFFTYEGQFKELLRNRSPGEFELNRPADGWPERVFRVSLYYVSASCILGLFISKEDIEKRGGAIASVAGFLFLGCAFYALNYAVWRYVKSKFVKVAWWSFIGVLLVLFLGSMVFKL